MRCLLIEPFPESALNEQAGKMLLENYEEYARHARSAFLLSTINEQSYCFPAIHCYCPMAIAAGYIPVFMPLNPAPDQRPELSRSQPRL